MFDVKLQPDRTLQIRNGPSSTFDLGLSEVSIYSPPGAAGTTFDMLAARFVAFLHLLLIDVVLPIHSRLDHWMRRQDALGLQVHANGDQLIITWNQEAISSVHRAVLEITDGTARSIWSISADLRSVTYVRETDDMEIRLIVDGTQAEVARCLSVDALTPRNRIDDEIRKFDADLADVRVLRDTVQNGTLRVLSLQREALTLLKATQAFQSH